MRRRDESGITLVELVVTLGILFILAAVSVSAASLLRSTWLTGRTKGAGDQLSTAVRNARQLAITGAEDYCIKTSTPSGSGQYEIYRGGRSGTNCLGTSVEGPVELSNEATVTTAAFKFTPVSTVDPVGGSVTISAVDPQTSQSCQLILTITPEGGVRLPGAVC
jgi:Tfp pilus assembly protein FimT